MHRSIATVSMSGTLPDKLAAIAAAGFDGIELFENDFIGFRGTGAELRAMAAELGLSIDLYQPFRDFEGMPEAQFRKNLERAERKFDVMQALGVPLMLCCSNTSPLARGDQALAAFQLHELAERASRRGLRVGFEALAWGRHTRCYRQAWSIVEQAAHPALGLILDSFHTLALRDDPSGIADIPGDRIFFLQMADAPVLAMDVMQWARHHRSFPGQGELDVEGFLLQTLRSGYAGPLSLEVFNDVFREASNRRIAVDALRSLRYLEDRVGQRLRDGQEQTGPRDGAAGRRVQATLAVLPPEPALTSVAFVEFAVDEPHAESLGAVLLKMGFTREARHRSKAATLYRKGQAALVLNTEPGSFARARFGSFGASVCAIGLCVEDPAGAFARATALRSMPFQSPVGPKEFATPAIVAPGGIVIHFIPSALGQAGLFGIDFALEKPWAAAGAGAEDTAIDHIALCLSPDQRDTWMLFARAVLGLAPDAREQYADPHGLTSSIGVSNAARSVRLALTVSQSQRTRATQAANAQGGVAVNLVSLSTNDIFAEARAWRDNGVALVTVPGNYHDDLAARYALEPGRLARMREHGVLFDRDAAGDYLHLYTEDVSNRFCLQLAQRVGGYAGYGASNAAIKLAVQAQAQAGGASS